MVRTSPEHRLVILKEGGDTVRRGKRGLDHARSAITEWVLDYNTARPHSSLGYQTPAAFAEDFTAAGSPVAQPAPYGEQKRPRL